MSYGGKLTNLHSEIMPILTQHYMYMDTVSLSYEHKCSYSYLSATHSSQRFPEVQAISFCNLCNPKTVYLPECLAVCLPTAAQTPGETKFCTVATDICGASLGMELVACHPSGTQNFEFRSTHMGFVTNEIINGADMVTVVLTGSSMSI